VQPALEHGRDVEIPDPRQPLAGEPIGLALATGPAGESGKQVDRLLGGGGE
jgi:hypothetical protein